MFDKDGVVKGGGVVYTDSFICAECGRLKYKNQSWAYKRKAWKNHKPKLTYFCSYSCMRKWDAEHEKGRKHDKETTSAASAL